ASSHLKRNSFHEYLLPLVAGSSVAACHGPSSTRTSTAFSGVPSFIAKPNTVCSLPSLPGEPKPPFGEGCRVTRAITDLSCMRVNLRQPFHVGDAVPAGNEQPQRESLHLRERLAVQGVGEKGLGRQRLLAREAQAELLLDFEGLRAEFDGLFAVIRPEKDELA